MAFNNIPVCAEQTGQWDEGQMRPGDDTPASNSELASPSAAAQLAHAQAQVHAAEVCSAIST